MHRCPHCEKKGISDLRKLFLGPALPATCQVCGKRVGVPWSSMLLLLPLLLAVLAQSLAPLLFAGAGEQALASLTAVLVVFVITTVAWRRVPLVKR